MGCLLVINYRGEGRIEQISLYILLTNRDRGVIVRRKLLMISASFTVIFISLLVIGWLLGIDFLHTNREGDIIQTSSDANELISKSEFLSFLDGNIVSCKWYFQVADKSGSIFFRMYDYCYNGEAVLKGDYFDFITEKYNWVKYDYEKQHQILTEDDFVLSPMYDVSMIRDSLRSKLLYACDDPTFSDNWHFTFLDKENKILYFYWLSH